MYCRERLWVSLLVFIEFQLWARFYRYDDRTARWAAAWAGAGLACMPSLEPRGPQPAELRSKEPTIVRVQDWIADPVSFGRRHLGPLFELLLGWVLLVYGVLRLLGRVHTEQRGRYLSGGLALAAGSLLLGHACSRLGTGN